MPFAVCSSAHQGPSEKRSTLKVKNLLPKFFPLRVDPFSEGKQFAIVVSPAYTSICLQLVNIQNIKTYAKRMSFNSLNYLYRYT